METTAGRCRRRTPASTSNSADGPTVRALLKPRGPYATEDDWKRDRKRTLALSAVRVASWNLARRVSRLPAQAAAIASEPRTCSRCRSHGPSKTDGERETARHFATANPEALSSLPIQDATPTNDDLLDAAAQLGASPDGAG